VKVVTASNIWAGVFGEKSTEVSYVVRTTAAEENVGRTDKPESIVITDENGVSKEVELKDGVNEYDVTVNDISSVNISVKGVSESDNVYVNNQRITDGVANISVNEDNRKVRVIVQNGDKEPVIYILNIKSDTAIKTENIFNEVTDKFNNGEVPIVNSIGGEWKVIGLSRASQISDTFKEGYFKNAYEYVKAIGSSKLHNAKSTDNSRMILALTSLGYDVTDIAGYNLLEPLGDFDYDVKQGVNGAIWALIALDSNDYKVPSLSDDEMAALKDKLINFILDNQMSNGGFTLNGDEDDVDITAMAVQALAKYYNESEAVEDAVDGALRYFEMVQNSDGSFGNYAATNCESTAQVVIALSVMGINPRTETRFIKNGVSVMSALNSLYLSDGNFCHLKGGDANEMATEQAYLALVAYKRLVENSTSIYDMSDVTKISNPVIKDDDKKDDNKSDDNKSDDNKKDDNKSDNKSDNNGNNSTDTSIKNNDKTSGNDKDSLPKTGDYTNILLYALLMTASGTGVYVIYRIKRKKDVTA
ncbi:MAG: prenyltransferase/squalene oxidase repeat-containing protein, partial [Lachnospiraceae bacterium]|nr:prenyltransferase/squalene oxidase repeat-containing protein [Lachnospiraceae bacterium]